jgi:YggT family protein
MIYAVLGIVDFILQIITWIIFAQIILSWLVAFNVINTSSHFVRSALSFLDRVTAPLYRPIRRLLPDFGGIDFSPMVILLAIFLLRNKVLPGILLEVGPTIT